MLAASPMVLAEPISMMQDAGIVFSAPRLEIPSPAQKISSLVKKNPLQKKQASKLQTFYGTASWYSEKDPGINRFTANGEIFDDSKLTCASWHFPFGTLLEVKNKANQKTVVCRVNDRGPAKRLDRAIDLTKNAFSQIAPLRQGLIQVEIKKKNPR